MRWNKSPKLLASYKVRRESTNQHGSIASIKSSRQSYTARLSLRNRHEATSSDSGNLPKSKSKSDQDYINRGEAMKMFLHANGKVVEVTPAKYLRDVRGTSAFQEGRRMARYLTQNSHQAYLDGLLTGFHDVYGSRLRRVPRQPRT
jgi:hypothetical protein